MLDPPETRPLLDSEEFADDSAQIDSGTLRNIESITIPETATYGRYLTWSNVYLLILSQCFGSGIFATPGAVVQSTGSIGLTLLAWAVGASISAIDLAGCIEYGCMFPRSGGDQLYLEFTYRRPRFLASTLYATTIVLFSSSSSDCFVFSKYTLFALGLEATVAKQRLFALGLLVVTISIHGCFLKPGIWIQNFLGWVNILVAVLMVITSLFVVAFQQGPDAGYPSLSSLFSWDHLWHGSNWQLSNFSVALLKVYNIFLAMCSPNYILNEVQNPIGTLKTVGPAAWLTVVIFYALILFAYLSVLPISIIKNSGELVATRFFERVLGHGLGKIILPLIIAGSAAGNVMSTIFISARINQEVARQGILPYSRLIASSRPFNTPLGGLIVHFIPTVLLILLPPPGDVYSFILDVLNYPDQFVTLAIAFGLILLRWRRPELRRPFRSWLPAAWLRVLISVVLIISPFFPPENGKGDVHFFYATYAIIGIVVICLSVLYWWLWTIVVPKWKGYQLGEEVEVLTDGTSITKLTHRKTV